jgi:hypothetical protein
MSCTSNGAGTTLKLFASSSESGSVIDGTTVGPANTQIELTNFDTSTASSKGTSGVLNLEAPSGNQALLVGADDVNSLGAPCWANFAGIH